ncbi:type II toxin-antitoxin system RelE/ParE family toxin [Candidatus Pantoea formicae]|uniref:type II toxin-antitoxin system RelE/ParE family toxin n=1 Tax=Candidatus Pantoea formicae TaxID=2608355 RepID=UPI003ED88CB6
MRQFRIAIAPMAEWTLKDIESYKIDTIGAKLAAEFVDKLLIDAVAAIMQDPLRYRFSHLLSQRGLNLRERLDPDSEYRVLYDFDGETVQILMFLSMKQDFVTTLYRYQILK